MLSRESWILLLIVLADTFSTYWLIRAGLAVEANPIVDWFIQLSWFAFFAVKGATLAVAILFAEWYRRKNADFVQRWLRYGILGYLSIWTLGVLFSGF